MVDKVGIEPTAFRVQTGCSSAELPAHDPPRERGGVDVDYLYGWVGGARTRSLVLRRHVLVRSSCNPMIVKDARKTKNPGG